MGVVSVFIFLACLFPIMTKNDNISTKADAYRDFSTIHMMISCGIVGLCWLVSSIATKRHHDKVAREVQYNRLQLCVR